MTSPMATLLEEEAKIKAEKKDDKEDEKEKAIKIEASVKSETMPIA